jgi:hypothetical protein
MFGNSPSFVTESPWQMPHACTLIRTCLFLGSGTARSTISNEPWGLETCTERNVLFYLLLVFRLSDDISSFLLIAKLHKYQLINTE